MAAQDYIKKACVEGLTQSIHAEKRGADRIKLCARLDLDGLTPDTETILAVKESCNIPIRVIIRPRGGGFEYSDDEFSEMKVSIIKCKEIGVDSVDFGIRRKNKKPNIQLIAELIQLTKPLKETVNKSIYSVKIPKEELKSLECKQIVRPMFPLNKDMEDSDLSVCSISEPGKMD